MSFRPTRSIGAFLVAAALVAAGCGQKAGVHVATSAGSASAAAAPAGADTTDNTSDTAAAGDTVPGAATTGGATAAGGSSGAAKTTATVAGGAPAPGGTTATTAAAAAGGGAADRTGVSDTEIKVGIHAPVSGAAPFPASSFDMGKAVYFNFINGKGGINGRKVTVTFKDDGYNPSQAVAVCKSMVQESKVFMLVGGGGADQIVASRSTPRAAASLTSPKVRRIPPSPSCSLSSPSR